MSKKQTAVDFLEEQILLTSPIVYKLMKENNDFNQAKEIFEQQMKDAALSNVTKNEGLRKIFETQFEQYYSEIYGYEEI
jgi:hypothetical protein